MWLLALKVAYLRGEQDVCLQVVNTIEAAHPDKPRPALPPKVTEMAKLRNDIMVVPQQTGDALVHPALDQRQSLHAVLAAAIWIVRDAVRLAGVTTV